MEYIGENELNHKLDDFKNHLEHADRMILSAKFGDGKSFFLQKIREDRERFPEYEFITIYPVNYVVAQNEDIFEYIKRDTLIQLTNLKLIEKIDLKKLITSIGSFENFKEVLFFLISSIPQYGPIIKKLLEKAIDISKKYNDEKATYDKYFSTFKYQRGGLYEDDAYTQMIKEALNLLKSGYIDEKGKVVQKKPVLIIEDLDRLDPAHLFRILNVISAHIDDVMKPDKIGNKFGFSNIVIVMDYDTTKHIFEHFYGKNASYEGYMSKFLVEEPFKYSIIELAIAKLKTKLSEEIGIDILFTNSLSILNLKIASFSMRDIVRIYDFDVHHRIKQNKYEINDKLCLSTSLPIFKLILYMIEFGMSIGDIQEDLSYHIGYNVKEYLKLVFPLYAMEKKKKNKVFDLETDLIQAKLEFSEDLATSVSVGYPEYQTGSAPSFSKEMRLSVINDILCMNRHIDIASLNVNVGFTIPNYKSLI
jgi:hypothetical protein